ncbi:hypothetical protein [Xanthomonas bundabergensis]|uniref:hypothetical protein n=1 Tax=Xanthomonas bundabergensis TaxID=3160842 RepID=UPI0035110015
MKNISIFAVVIFGFFNISSAFAASSCDSRDLVVVELDVVKGKEVFKVNDTLVKPRDTFDTFFRNCARKTVILASPEAKISQVINVRFFLGKIGIKTNRDNFFVFFASSGARSMTYMETFATIKYTKNRDELMKITENPPQESNWL